MAVLHMIAGHYVAEQDYLVPSKLVVRHTISIPLDASLRMVRYLNDFLTDIRFTGSMRRTDLVVLPQDDVDSEMPSLGVRF